MGCGRLREGSCDGAGAEDFGPSPKGTPRETDPLPFSELSRAVRGVEVHYPALLVPTVAEGRGRGKGRQRMYSYGDLIRMRIARELREQKVSLETLRTIVQRLAPVGRKLASAHFVLVGREVEVAGSKAELMAILSRPRRRTFGVLLDLREILETVRENARLVAAGPRRAES
jgi:DNA-binding transcriptional MerR regulator